MANSLRAKISKLRHDRNISDFEYQELIKKLDGHDTKIRAYTIDEFKNSLINWKTTDEEYKSFEDVLEEISEQLKVKK